MFNLYVKQLVEGEEGKYTYLHLEAETDAEREEKRQQYLADKWEETTKEDWEANFESRKGAELDGNPEAQLAAAKEAGTLSGVDAEAAAAEQAAQEGAADTEAAEQEASEAKEEQAV